MTAHLLLAVHHCKNHGTDVGPLLCNAKPKQLAFWRGFGPGGGIALLLGAGAGLWQWFFAPAKPAPKKGK